MSLYTTQLDGGPEPDAYEWAVLGLCLVAILLAAVLMARPRQDEFEMASGLTTIYTDDLVPGLLQAVRADGSTEATIDLGTGGNGMPDCRSIAPECRWKGSVVRSADGRGLVEVELVDSKGTVVGRAQLMEVETAEFAELAPLREAGYSRGWIGHVQIARAYRGSGMGRLVWEAGDSFLRIVSAGSGAVRVVYDTVGWGESLMRAVQRFLVEEAPLWAYLID